MEYNLPKHLKGLNDKEVKKSQALYGYNQVDRVQTAWYVLLLDILKEPMLLLLFAVTAIYIIVGNYSEALFMFGAIIAVSAISFYQDNRSKKALEELEKLNEPFSKVIRNSKLIEIPTHEIAVGDLCIVEEGKMIQADGKILHSNDFSVNESTLTGESFTVFKSEETENQNVYSGTVVISGLAVFEVEKIGKETKLGKIGTSIQNIKEQSSPLQQQISKFVRIMAIIGIVVFMMVWLYSYWQTQNIIESLLVGLTLAMSILPEEIPVAFTTFMALGAWKLMRDGIIIKRSNIVETLGSTTVICADKTGTITKNTMQLKQLYDFKSDKIYDENEFEDAKLNELIAYSMWSSEPIPFDPMEKTLHKIYENSQKLDLRKDFKMIHEYPLEGRPPMMTHILENQLSERIIAAKGAPEGIIEVCQLTDEEKFKLRQKIKDFGKQGYRILGVAKCDFSGSVFPKKQQELKFQFLGFTLFYDPPKEGIEEVFRHIYDAGIKLKLITGDNTDTTLSIAQQSGMRNTDAIIEGTQIMEYSEEELGIVAEEKVLFTRMFPEAKLAVVNALKAKGEVVAMLGDGINDAPALKAAHIGVAMGTKGTEIAKAAASYIITNDDLDKLIVGIAAGRRIYANIKKAIQYIISIHIPIILTVSLPLFLGWVYPHIFTPVHVIFLELIMGPTCSIVYENEPMEKNTMIQKPRKITETFLSGKELILSILQGLLITVGILIAYQWAVQQGGSEENTRAIVFSTLIFANILLSLTNRSFYYSLFDSFKNNNWLFPLIIGLTLLLLMLILYIPKFSNFFHLSSLNGLELFVSFIIAGVSVLWFEIYKWIKRKNC